jgi:hypothetical protein
MYFQSQFLRVSHSQRFNSTFASSPGDGRSVFGINGVEGAGGGGLDAAAPPSAAGEKEDGNAWPYTTADLLAGGFEEDEGTAFAGSAGLGGGGGGSLLGALPFTGAGVLSSFICSLSAMAYASSSLSYK